MAGYIVNMTCGCEIDGKVYMSSKSINGLFEYDFNEGVLNYIMPFSGEKPCYALHGKAFSHGDEAWFVPQHGTKIAIFNTMSGNLSFIDIPYKKKWRSPLDGIDTVSYVSGIYKERYLYVLPAGVDVALVINMDNREVTYIHNLIKEGEYISTAIVVDDEICAFLGGSNDIIKINLSDYLFSRAVKKNRIVELCCIKENKLYGLIEEKNGNRELQLVSAGYFSDEEGNVVMSSELPKPNIGNMICCNDELIFLPWKSGEIYRCLKEDNLRFLITDIGNYIGKENYAMPLYSKERLLFTTLQGGYLLWKSAADAEIQCTNLRINYAEMSKRMAEYFSDENESFFENNNVFGEEEMGLGDFLELVMEG